MFYLRHESEIRLQNLTAEALKKELLIHDRKRKLYSVDEKGVFHDFIPVASV
jgi:hypothetical protein